MKKSDVKFYTNALIQADIDFLQYQVSKRGVTLISGTGLQKLIDECQTYIILPPDSEIYNSTIKPVLVLYSLSDSLRMLWMKRKDFKTQLGAMNSGTYEYGTVDGANDHYFKDFEFELSSAAYLNEYGVSVDLPQHTTGNDIFYGDLEIQCKHPNTLKRDKIDGFLRDFQSSMQNNQSYGVFGIGLDDYLAFKDNTFPIDYENYEKAYRKALQEQDSILQQVFDSTLPYCPRVLGVFLVNTFFSYNTNMGLSLMKTTNSVFCVRPNAKVVPEESHIKAYEILPVFNSKPSIRSY